MIFLITFKCPDLDLNLKGCVNIYKMLRFTKTQKKDVAYDSMWNSSQFWNELKLKYFNIWNDTISVQ